MNTKRATSVRLLFQRRERDSNPRRCDPQRFSRPPQSTTLPSLLSRYVCIVIRSRIRFTCAKVGRFLILCKFLGKFFLIIFSTTQYNTDYHQFDSSIFFQYIGRILLGIVTMTYDIVFYFLEKTCREDKFIEGFVGCLEDFLLIPYPIAISFINKDNVFTDTEH